MTEIRPVKMSEAEAFLDLLCEVFGLDRSRAHSIFFNEPMFDLRRKWGLFEGNQMVSILTTVPLHFGWGNAVGIAGVATRTDRQNEGLASRLLTAVMVESDRSGEGAVMLFAKNARVYEKNGFEPIDKVIRAPILSAEEELKPRVLDFDEVERHYTDWSRADPNRLRRDDQRWSFWKWTLRVCTEFGGGYLCSEGSLVREAVSPEPVRNWHLPGPHEFLGLASMAENLQVPLAESELELHLMGYRVPARPQMFMTDQF